jgi:prepilin-type N-terminal cleavage/methylation domain-containing protein
MVKSLKGLNGLNGTKAFRVPCSVRQWRVGNACSEPTASVEVTQHETRITHHELAAFTLLEVMIAVAILCIALFAILDLTNQSWRSARAIQQANVVDFGSAATQLLLTNRLEEGSYNGDFGESYPNHDWSAEVYEVATNGLFEIDFSVRERHQGWDKQTRQTETKSSIWVYRPESAVRTGVGRR